MNSIDIDLEDRYRSDVKDNVKKVFVLALQGLYEVEVGGWVAYKAAKDVIPAGCSSDLADKVSRLVIGVAGELEELDEIIANHLTCNWTVERLGTMERNSLRLGTYIMKYGVWSSRQSVREIAANCVSEYGNPDAHRLIMAVLDAIGRDIQ